MDAAASKQGFRFHKSGGTSPLPPSSVAQPSREHNLQRVPSHPSLVSEAEGAASGGGGGAACPPGVDAKLFQIVRRIAVATPSLLINNSSGEL